MLTIHPEQKKRFVETVRFARKIGLLNKLVNALRYLHNYANHDDSKYHKCKVTLYYDFAPHSFSIVWRRREDEHSEWKYWFQGGFMFHGPHDNGGDGGAPTYSVNLTPCHGWSIHT